jgi:hypothetical protein
MRGVFFAAMVVASAGGTSACSMLTSFDGFGGEPGGAGGSSSGSAASLYRAAVLTDKPLAYWRFGEASGATAADETGQGHSAAIGTGVTWGATGALMNDANTAVGLVGAQGLQITDGGFDFPETHPFSLEGWVMLSAPIDANSHHLYVKNDSTNPMGRQEYGVYLDATDGLAFERYVDSGLKRLQTALPAVNAWTYFVATYNGTGLALYVNGALVANAPDTRSQLAIPDTEYLGCKSFTDPSVVGTLDEFAVYGSALTQDRITAHYKASGR